MTEEKSPFELDDALEYADGGKRFLAYIIDSIVLVVGIFGISGTLMFGVFGVDNVQPGSDGYIPFFLTYTCFLFFAPWLYFAFMESSSKQGTLGKIAMKIRVTDEAGNRISFGRATGRYFGKILSALILYIGFLMILWDKKQQGLHDKVAGTVVVY